MSLRALVIFCALLSLCVSDTVGPRLLPLPAGATGSTAIAERAVEGSDVTPTPSREEAAVVRVVMAAPARKQVGAGHHSPHDAAQAAAVFFTPPATDLLRQSHSFNSSIPATFAAEARPPGRAPPPSI